MTAEDSLRERKKRATRRRIAEVALRLFAERGFEDVTVAEVAAAADVSVKTVFNYFPTKEDLVLDGREEIEAELVRAVRGRAPGEPVLAAVRRHTLSVAERVHTLPAERRAAFQRVVQRTPAVHLRMRQMSLRSEALLAQLLMEETGAAPNDPTPLLVAGLLGMLARLAFGGPGWPDSPERSYAETIAGIEAAFALAAGGLAEYGRREQL